MEEKFRVPRTLHEPIQILWFYQDELMVIVVCYLFGMVIGGLTWLMLIIGPMLYIRMKRRNPRGFLTHFLIDNGILKLVLYPNNYINEYNE